MTYFYAVNRAHADRLLRATLQDKQRRPGLMTADKPGLLELASGEIYQIEYQPPPEAAATATEQAKAQFLVSRYYKDDRPLSRFFQSIGEFFGRRRFLAKPSQAAHLADSLNKAAADETEAPVLHEDKEALELNDLCQSLRNNDPHLQVLSNRPEDDLLTPTLPAHLDAYSLQVLLGSLQKNTVVTALHLQDVGLGGSGAKRLAKVLARRAPLTSLVLVNNQIGDEGTQALARVLARQGSLSRLRLSANRIGDRGGKALAKLLWHNKRLRKLDLSANSIGDPGARALAAGLKRHPALTELDLGHNGIGDSGMQALTRALQNTSKLAAHHDTRLSVLRLNNNYCGDDGAIALAEVLINKPTLRELDLSTNLICRAGAAALLAGLQHRSARRLPTLERFMFMHGNGLLNSQDPVPPNEVLWRAHTWETIRTALEDYELVINRDHAPGPALCDSTRGGPAVRTDGDRLAPQA